MIYVVEYNGSLTGPFDTAEQAAQWAIKAWPGEVGWRVRPMVQSRPS